MRLIKPLKIVSPRWRLLGSACLLVALVVGGVVFVRFQNATGTLEIDGQTGGGSNASLAFGFNGLQDWADGSDAIAIIEIESEGVNSDWNGEFDESSWVPREVSYRIVDTLYSNRVKLADGVRANGGWSERDGKRSGHTRAGTWLEVGERYLVSFYWSTYEIELVLRMMEVILLSGDKLIDPYGGAGFEESTVQELMASLSRTPRYQEPGVDLSTCGGLDRQLLRMWAETGTLFLWDRPTILARCGLPPIGLAPITVPGVATPSVSVPHLSIPTASVPPVTVPSVSLPGPTSTTTSSSLPATSASTTVANP